MEIWTSKGVNLAVTHFVTQFIHVSSHLELGIENKQKF